MNYFKVLGIIFGLLALLKPVYMHVIPWDENKFIEKAYAENRPSWILPVAVVGLMLVAFTWYKHFALDVPYSIVLTIIFSITAIKALALIFNYKRFYEWVTSMLNKDKGRDIVLVDIGAGLFGLVVVLLAVFIY